MATEKATAKAAKTATKTQAKDTKATKKTVAASTTTPKATAKTTTAKGKGGDKATEQAKAATQATAATENAEATTAPVAPPAEPVAPAEPPKAVRYASESKMLPVDKLIESPLNFFNPLSAEKFAEMLESIKANGILVPLIVRPQGDVYEILAGHNRRRAAMNLGISEVPVTVITEPLTDEQAKEIMVDTNVVQRHDFTPMELARAYEEKAKAIGNRQGQRTDKDANAAKGATREIIAKDLKVSGITVDRFRALNRLIPELQNAVDKGQIAIKAGVAASALDPESQKQIYREFENKLSELSASKVNDLREKFLAKNEIAKSQMRSLNPVDKENLKPLTSSDIAPVAKEKPETVRIILDFTKDGDGKELFEFVKGYGNGTPSIVDFVKGLMKDAI